MATKRKSWGKPSAEIRRLNFKAAGLHFAVLTSGQQAAGDNKHDGYALGASRCLVPST